MKKNAYIDKLLTAVEDLSVEVLANRRNAKGEKKIKAIYTAVWPGVNAEVRIAELKQKRKIPNERQSCKR
jgi:hypothetical protein